MNNALFIIFALLFLVISYNSHREILQLKHSLNNIDVESEVHATVKTPVVTLQNRWNVPTQPIETYRQLGVLYANNGMILPLLGRRINSTNWQYYTLTNDAIPLKLPIEYKNRICTDHHGCNELYDDDEIHIRELSAKFNVRLYHMDYHAIR